MLRKLFIGCITLFVFYSCLDKYNLNIEGYEDLLVVDGLITDENTTHDITLKHTTSNIDKDSPYVTGAEVYVTDSNGRIYYFEENTSGIYSSDSTDLVVEVGDKYTLHIKTQDGVTYQSDECTVLPKTTIDSVYYKKDEDWDVSGEYLNDGISFYVDSYTEDTSTYVRMLYDEDWKFRTRYPERMIITENEEYKMISPIVNWECWKHYSSNEIDVFSFGNQAGTEIKEKKVTFVASSVSDRLTVRYCLNAKQLSISKEEYEYWRKLKESTEEVGDVFAKQPYSLTGNVYNIDDENEPVLGFFQVGAVTSKRLYVDYEDLSGMNLPLYYGNCEIDSCMLEDYNNSLYEIYDTEVLNGDGYLYEFIYNEVGGLIGLYVSKEVKCTYCSETGNPDMPDFWEDE